MPINFFGGAGSVTQDMLDYIGANLTDTTITKEHEASLNFTGEWITEEDKACMELIQEDVNGIEISNLQILDQHSHRVALYSDEASIASFGTAFGRPKGQDPQSTDAAVHTELVALVPDQGDVAA